MAYYRISLGILAAVFVTVGAAMWLEGSDQNRMFAGVIARVGVMMGIVSIALPQLKTPRNRISAFLIAILVVLLIVAAARPKLFPLLLVISLAVIFVNGILRRLSKRRPS
jgi:hypothetical protein